MKNLKWLAIALMAAWSCAAQEPTPKPCSTHIRQFSNLHWLSSNMCPEDYQRWLEPRKNDRWYKDKSFWTGVGVIGASVAVDGISTAQGQPRLTENNWFLGPHPSNAKIATLDVIGFSTYFGLHLLEYKFSHNDPSKTWRFIGRWSIPAVAATLHGQAAAHNYSLNEGGRP